MMVVAEQRAKEELEKAEEEKKKLERELEDKKQIGRYFPPSLRSVCEPCTRVGKELKKANCILCVSHSFLVLALSLLYFARVF